MKVEMIIPRKVQYRLSRQARIDHRMIRMEWDFPKHSYVECRGTKWQVIGYYAKENCGGLKVRDEHRFVGCVPIYYHDPYMQGKGGFDPYVNCTGECHFCKVESACAAETERVARILARESHVTHDKLREFPPEYWEW